MFGVANGSLTTFEDFRQARDVILGLTNSPWPYFVLLDGNVPSKMISVFESTPAEHEYIEACGFDLFLHEIDEHKILVFKYGQFAAAISLVSRDTSWISIFQTWKVSYVGCPAPFQHLHG